MLQKYSFIINNVSIHIFPAALFFLMIIQTKNSYNNVCKSINTVYVYMYIFSDTKLFTVYRLSSLEILVRPAHQLCQLSSLRRVEPMQTTTLFSIQSEAFECRARCTILPPSSIFWITTTTGRMNCPVHFSYPPLSAEPQPSKS